MPLPQLFAILLLLVMDSQPWDACPAKIQNNSKYDLQKCPVAAAILRVPKANCETKSHTEMRSLFSLLKESETEEVHHTCQGWWQIYPKKNPQFWARVWAWACKTQKIKCECCSESNLSNLMIDPLLQTLHTVVFLTQHPTQIEWEKE